jgi:putative transposase
MDYRRNGQARFRTMTLEPNEFIRRFLLHVLPKAFHRIRRYGLLASATCKANIARARELIATPPPSIDRSTEQDTPGMTTGAKADYRPPCPCCGGRMIIVESFGLGGAPRAPPSSQAGVGTAMP